MAEPGEEYRFRRNKGVIGIWQNVLSGLIPLIGIISILNLPTYFGLSFYIQQYLAIFLGFILSLNYLLVPSKKGASMDRLPWFDFILSIISLIVGLYIALFYKELVIELGLLIPHRIILGTMAIILILEASRRLLGWPFVIIIKIPL